MQINYNHVVTNTTSEPKIIDVKLPFYFSGKDYLLTYYKFSKIKGKIVLEHISIEERNKFTSSLYIKEFYTFEKLSALLSQLSSTLTFENSKFEELKIKLRESLI